MATRRSGRGALLSAAVAIGIALSVAACSGSAAGPVLDGTGGAAGAPMEAPAYGETGAAPAPAGDEFASDADRQGQGGSGAAAAFRDDASIVRTGSLQVEVKELDPALLRARAAIVGLGGYVSASDEAREADQPIASITYRIPSDRWDDAVEALRALGTPLGGKTSAVEVTGQLVDLEARIANLRSTESALQAIMVKATKISDILEVQQQLTGVRGQIEELTAQQAHLEDQATYGTLTVMWTVELAAVVETTKKWDLADEVDRATASLLDLLQALAGAGIWLAIVWLPLIAAVAVVVGLVALVVRRLGFGRSVPPSAPATPPAL